MNLDPAKIQDQIANLVLSYGPKLISAILTLIIGLWVINLLMKGLNKLMVKSNTDPSLRSFLRSIAGIALKVMLIISVAGMVGIETTSFIAVLGAAGLAVGMALQGSLSNFAGGVLILIFKPFKVGDLIIAQGNEGTVKEIQIFCTILKTPDNRTIIIPNGPLAGGNIENVTTEPTRRLNLTFGIGYSDSIDEAKEVLMNLMSAHPKILKDPAPEVLVNEQAASSINLAVRPWVNKEDYWEVFHFMQEHVKKKFDERGISIPFAQHDIYIHQVPSQLNNTINQ